MAKVCGAENWIALNIDAHFDVRADSPRHSGTPYRQLLEENFIKPHTFFEIGWQAQANSTAYFNYLKDKKVNLFSLEEIQNSKLKIRDLFEQMYSQSTASNSLFFGFDVDAVRAADAPGVSAPLPVGLTAEEFIEIAKFAGENRQTRIIEFTEMNPLFDIDNRTAKLVAVAMHRFCAARKQKS